MVNIPAFAEEHPPAIREDIMTTAILQEKLQQQFDELVPQFAEEMKVNGNPEDAPIYVAALLWPLLHELSDDVDVISLHPLVFLHARPGIFVEDRGLRRYLKEMGRPYPVAKRERERSLEQFESMALTPFWVKLTRDESIEPSYRGRRMKICVVPAALANFEPWSSEMAIAVDTNSMVIGTLKA